MCVSFRFVKASARNGKIVNRFETGLARRLRPKTNEGRPDDPWTILVIVDNDNLPVGPKFCSAILSYLLTNLCIYKYTQEGSAC